MTVSETEIGTSGTSVTGSPPLTNGSSSVCRAWMTSSTPMKPGVTARP